MKQITFLGNFRVDFSSETHHAITLSDLGYNVIRLQETEATSGEVLRASLNSDLFIWVHTHGWNTPGRFSMEQVLLELKDAGIPTMTYHLDLWFGLKRQRDLKTHTVYKDIGHFFTVDSKMADWFNTKTSVRGHYLPAGVFDKEATYKKTKPVRDVIFVGSKNYHQEWPYRPKLINWLEKTYSKDFTLYGKDGVGVVRGKDLNEVYASTKIVVGDTLCPNFDYPDYWSDRIYETLGRGGFMIHPYIPGLEREFTDKENIVFYRYNDFRQLESLIEYYLDHDDERERIRLAGHQLVKNNYTYKNRWQSILKELNI